MGKNYYFESLDYFERKNSLDDLCKSHYCKEADFCRMHVSNNIKGLFSKKEEKEKIYFEELKDNVLAIDNSLIKNFRLHEKEIIELLYLGDDKSFEKFFEIINTKKIKVYKTRMKYLFRILSGKIKE